jgi:hypothetical protein
MGSGFGIIDMHLLYHRGIYQVEIFKVDLKRYPPAVEKCSHGTIADEHLFVQTLQKKTAARTRLIHGYPFKPY